jgi:RHS repeat-associated protein
MALPLQGIAFEAYGQGTTALPIPPYWDYGTLAKQFFPSFDDAAEVDMRADCAQRDLTNCELLDAKQTSSGYTYHFRWRPDGQPGDKDPEWETRTGTNFAYLSCEANYSLYMKAFGQLIGPYPNQQLEVVGVTPPSPYTAVCSFTPDPQTSVELQADLGEGRCSAEPGAMVGNPINVGASNKFQSVTDLPATVASALVWERFYNSGVAYVDTANGRPIGTTVSRTARLGSRWRSTFDRSIERAVVTTPGGIEEVARLHRHDGARIDYYRRATGYVSAVDGRGSLVRSSAGWTYRSNEGSEEDYDIDGRMTSLRFPGGAELSLAYSDASTPPDVAPSRGLLIKVSDRAGRSFSLKYDSVGRLSSVTDDHGLGVNYTYDETDGKKLDADLARTVYADGSAVEYKYNEREHTEMQSLPHALTGVIDENGIRFATFSYDGQGRAQNTTHALGAGSTFVLAETDDRKTVRGPTGELRAYQFEKIRGSRRLVKVNQPGGAGCGAAFSRIEYDGNGHVLTTQDFDGSLTRFVHDQEGKETERVEAADTPLARHIVTEWHQRLGLPVRRARQGYEETLAYDDRGNVTERILRGSVDPSDPSSALNVVRRWHITYNEDNRPLVVEGPRSDLGSIGVLARYTYRSADASDCSIGGACAYRRGDLWKTENALGQVEELLSYDRAGRVLARKDANGILTRHAYNPRGWLISTTTEDREGSVRTTTIAYTPSGQVKKFTDADGTAMGFEYDDAQRLVSIIDGAGNRIDYVLDAAGQRLKEVVKDTNGSMVRQMERTFDALGRIATETDGMGRTSQFTYDELDRWTGTTDGAGTKMVASRDALGRLHEVIGDTAGIKARIIHAHDPLDQVQSIRDPKGLTTSFLNTGLGDPAHVGSPDTGNDWNEFDAAGELTIHEAAQSKGSFAVTRDALGRALSRVYVAGDENVTYTYDVASISCPASETYGVGRLSRMDDRSGSTSYCYNANGQVARRIWTTGGATLTIAYRYTGAGRLTGLTYPDGTDVDWAHDKLGRVSSVDVTPLGSATQRLLGSIGWTSFGGASEWTYGNGRTLVRQYDASGKPTAVRDAHVGGLNYSLGYDDAGNVVRLDTAKVTRAYGYDGLGRLLTTHDGTSGVLLAQYDYDATGNRTAVHIGGGVDRYVYAENSHHLVTNAGSRRTYDAAGNTTAMGGMVLNYDGAGRLSSVSDGRNVRATYVYNGDGERVIRTEAGHTVNTIYDEQGHWLADYDSAGKAVMQAVWLGDHPIGIVTGENVHYIESDHLGTPRTAIDPIRNVTAWTWGIEGEAFGLDAPDDDVDRDGNSLRLDMRFPGQRFDAASGLHYNMQRDYDPETGRYIQGDPTGIAGGLSMYAYVVSGPLGASDAHGLRADTDLCAGLSAKACMHLGMVNTPDYVSANMTLIAGVTFGLTVTGDTVYWNKSISKSWSENIKFNTSTLKSLVKPSLSLDLGFLNSSVGFMCPSGNALEVRRAATNSFVEGYSMSAGAHFGPGASIVYLPDGRSATQVGFGFGSGFGLDFTPGADSEYLFGKGRAK